MSSISFERPHAGGALRDYLANLGQAVRQLGAALVAVRQIKTEPGRTDASVCGNPSQQPRKKDLAQLYQLANQYDSVMPNLAAELRYMASHD